MKVGLRFANSGVFTDPDRARALVRRVEEVGLESLWASDHVLMPLHTATPYPYSDDGAIPSHLIHLPLAEPLTWLTWAAAHSSRLILGTSVLVLPQRPAALVAKQAATLDVLSGGRLVLGVGAGWLRDEFDALQATFDDRGMRLEEAVGAMRALWQEGPTTFVGPSVAFRDVIANPKPVRRSIPIVIGGHSRAAARRAGRIGDGFHPA